jgi:sulfate/thiosulfate transport system substrate-binding protein
VSLRRRLLEAAAVAAVVVAAAVIAVHNRPSPDGDRLVNVSYDPTRELYQELDLVFAAQYQQRTGRHLTIIESHGGSSRQAHAVLTGEQPADVVTLGLYADVETLSKRGLIAPGWAERLPNHSQPYTSTVVFVVRRGNPKGIHDWPDLLHDGVEVITPSPRTSGNGKLSALAAWGAVTSRGGSEGDARNYLQHFYQHVSVMDEGARAASFTFADRELGDVQLTWENEAVKEAAESGGKLEVVYPPVSILAEPRVAWVDANVARDGTAQTARDFLKFLFSDEAQLTMARLGYRPYRQETLERAGMQLPSMTLFPISAVARDWDDAETKFFGDDGIVNMLIEQRPS